MFSINLAQSNCCHSQLFNSFLKLKYSPHLCLIFNKKILLIHLIVLFSLYVLVNRFLAARCNISFSRSHSFSCSCFDFKNFGIFYFQIVTSVVQEIPNLNVTATIISAVTITVCVFNNELIKVKIILITYFFSISLTNQAINTIFI